MDLDGGWVSGPPDEAQLSHGSKSLQVTALLPDPEKKGNLLAAEGAEMAPGGRKEVFRLIFSGSKWNQMRSYRAGLHTAAASGMRS